MDLSITLLEGASEPARAHSTDAGYDLFAYNDSVIEAKSSATFRTGVSMSIPDGYYGKIFSRSGLAVKNGIEVGAGVIDSGYRGEIIILLHNHSNNLKEIKTGDKIAQIVFMKYETFNIKITGELNNSDRGENGFGSTG